MCSSEHVRDAQEHSVQLCATCNRPVRRGRQGTITHFIFRAGQCQCELPRTAQTNFEQRKNPVFAGFIDDDEQGELDLPDDIFPVARYKPISEIGRGSYGSVYLCRDRLLEKKVAVKTLHTLSAEQLMLFQEEAKATSQLNHPNIVTTLDFGATESGVPFMVMEYVPGISLEQKLKKEKLTTSTLLEIAGYVCEALAYAHDRGVFHRDIKPSNILLGNIEADNMTVSLIDFGVALVPSQEGSVSDYQGRQLVGTPAYM
ncbi:MAG: serine/threonine protein kinase, partial [Cyanobacteria bacterium]|nr:serine/threonine protein kinase [Cyanobacteriota bacterium]